MSHETSFQQLRTPAAALASITIVLSLLDARATGLQDTDTIWFMLALITVTATLLGVVSRSSCRTQGLSGTVFAAIATTAVDLPATVEEHIDIHLSQVAPTLWALSGIMFGTAVATCLTQAGWHRRLIQREAPTTSLATMSVLGFLLGIVFCAVITLLTAVSPIVPLTCLVSVLIGYFVTDDLKNAVHYAVAVIPVPIVATAVTVQFFNIHRLAATPSPTTQ